MLELRRLWIRLAHQKYENDWAPGLYYAVLSTSRNLYCKYVCTDTHVRSPIDPRVQGLTLIITSVREVIACAMLDRVTLQQEPQPRPSRDSSIRKSGDPRPVTYVANQQGQKLIDEGTAERTGSHPSAAKNPRVSQPGLFPVDMSLKPTA